LGEHGIVLIEAPPELGNMSIEGLLENGLR